VHARYASLCGHAVTWRAGWDCHGLPLELAVEKRHGPKAKQQPGLFMQQCRAEATRWKDQQAQSMTRVGVMADMQRPWLTMDPKREAASLRLLLDLWQAGLLVERQSPVHWCAACQSALAASELEKATKERTELFFTVPLAAASSDALAHAARRHGAAWPAAPVHLMSWTTTPWTLWANAGFGHPERGALTLATLEGGRSVLVAVMARDRLLQDYPAMFSDPGLAFDGVMNFSDLPPMALTALSPLTNLEAPVLPAPFASEREGSGFVHLAPAFGPEDFELHESCGVRLDCHVGPDGRLDHVSHGVAMPASLQGTTLDAASAATCELLSQAGRLVHAKQNLVETSVCWRHKKAVFYRASRQWALDLHKPFEGCPEGLAQRAAAALGRTVFVPDDKARAPLALMLATRRFWTMSRDRLWGLPLPFFRHETSDQLHPDTAALWAELVRKVETGGVEAWQSTATPPGYKKCSQSVDVWFDSGAAWLSASENGRNEADLAVEGQDQTRGWFLSSFLLHAFRSRLPPFQKVMTHKFVVDENGVKFSKSKGGSPDPNVIFAQHGADVFRLWVCSQHVGDEMKWSKTSLRQATQDAKDWRSFLRFQLANMEERADAPQPRSLRPLDRLALGKLAATESEWRALMDGGRFNHALTCLSQFRQWASAEWFDLSKRTLYCAKDGDAALASVQWALRTCFLRCAQMLSTVMPFACEEAYLAWPGRPQASLFLHELVPGMEVCESDPAQLAMERTLAWRRQLLPLVERARGLVGKGAPVCLVFSGRADLEREMQLRELFPGCFVLQGDAGDELEKWEEDTASGALVKAGHPRTGLMPQRCDRCRGYFRAMSTVAGVCDQCVREVAMP
jgi:isoleucyl-tRNA synthetase